MKKLWKLFLWELELKIKFDPYNGVYDFKLGWIWIIYFTIKINYQIYFILLTTFN